MKKIIQIIIGIIAMLDIIAQLEREAAEQANKAGTLTREWSGIANDGTNMRGYLNDAGEVRSYFVDFVE